MNRFDLVIFDLDGTLVDSEPMSNRLFAEHLAAAGVPMTLEDCIRDLVGLSMPSCISFIETRHSLRLPGDFEARLQADTFKALRASLQPIPGVPEALGQIGPVPKCVASSSAPDKIALSLEVTGLAPHFGRNIFSAHEVKRGKPAPDLFLHAAERMGVAPHRAAVVEDSRYGIEAGLAAGMSVFAFVPDGVAGHVLPEGAVRFSQMDQLPHLLRVK